MAAPTTEAQVRVHERVVPDVVVVVAAGRRIVAVRLQLAAAVGIDSPAESHTEGSMKQ